MTMSINTRMVNEGQDLYYSPKWHRYIESHLQWIRGLPTNRPMAIEQSDAYKFEADLTGLLLAYKIPMEYHWIVMRLNDLTSPTAYTSDIVQLTLPDFSEIEKLRAVYSTTNKKI